MGFTVVDVKPGVEVILDESFQEIPDLHIRFVKKNDDDDAILNSDGVTVSYVYDEIANKLFLSVIVDHSRIQMRPGVMQVIRVGSGAKVSGIKMSAPGSTLDSDTPRERKVIITVAPSATLDTSRCSDINLTVRE